MLLKDTKLISARRILQSQEHNDNTSVYQHFVNCCEKLEVIDTVAFLDGMIVLAYIIANVDYRFKGYPKRRH